MKKVLVISAVFVALLCLSALTVFAASQNDNAVFQTPTTQSQQTQASADNNTQADNDDSEATDDASTTLSSVLNAVTGNNNNGGNGNNGSSSNNSSKSSNNSTKVESKNVTVDSNGVVVDTPSRDPQMVKDMTPSGAKIVSDTPKSLVMTSTQSASDLIAYYESALRKIGATQKSLVDTTKKPYGGWYYAGTYGDNKTITISISDGGSRYWITVTY
ncbi:MAG: hypothetical protein FWG40_10170 [Peptococcaceae bacterium]|nr:hypothetical protein [Peptococcaceae bacterium]